MMAAALEEGRKECELNDAPDAGEFKITSWWWQRMPIGPNQQRAKTRRFDHLQYVSSSVFPVRPVRYDGTTT